MSYEFEYKKEEFTKLNYEFFVIVANIGPKNAAFAIMGVKSKKVYDIIIKKMVLSKDIVKMSEILNELLKYAKDKYDIEVNRCCISASGPVFRKRDSIHITHLNLTISKAEILNGTMLNKVLLVNNFEAKGYGLDILDISKAALEIKKISEKHKVLKDPCNTFAVLGAERGLGVTMARYDEIRHLHMPIPSEGGHVDFNAQNEFELELVRFVKQVTNLKNEEYPDYEAILSEEGFNNIFDFIKHKKIHAETEITKSISKMNGEEKINGITLNYENDQTCKDTVDLFLKIYTRKAKALALISECYSGLFLTGKLAQINIHRLQEYMVKEFDNHSKKSEVLQRIPIYIINDKDLELYGCCNVAVNFYNIGGE